jgi:hypothetical protein
VLWAQHGGQICAHSPCAPRPLLPRCLPDQQGAPHAKMSFLFATIWEQLAIILLLATSRPPQLFIIYLPIQGNLLVMCSSSQPKFQTTHKGQEFCCGCGRPKLIWWLCCCGCRFFSRACGCRFEVSFSLNTSPRASFFLLM